jgi:hypothetical protein
MKPIKVKKKYLFIKYFASEYRFASAGISKGFTNRSGGMLSFSFPRCQRLKSCLAVNWFK